MFVYGLTMVNNIYKYLTNSGPIFPGDIVICNVSYRKSNANFCIDFLSNESDRMDAISKLVK